MARQKKGLRAYVLVMAIATGGAIGCSGPMIQMPITLHQGQFSVSFEIPQSLVPDAAKNMSASSSRVVDPTTSRIELWLKGKKEATIPLSEGKRDGSVWTGTFAGITAGTYNVGELAVRLLNSSSELLTAGTNTTTVVIPQSGTGSATIHAVPDASIVTPIVPGGVYDLSVAAGKSTYLKMSATHTKSADLYFFHAAAHAQVAAFNADGSIMTLPWNDQLAVGSIWPLGNDTTDFWWGSPTDQDCYIGIFPNSFDGSTFSSTVVAADESSAALVAAYGGSLINDPPDNFGLWVTPSQSSLPVTLESGSVYTLRFKLFNVTTSSYLIKLTGAPAVTVTGASDTRLSVGSQPWSTVFGSSDRPEFYVVFDASDTSNTLPCNATLSIPYVVLGTSTTGTYQIPLSITIGQREPQIFMYYNSYRIANGTTYDLGDIPIRVFGDIGGGYFMPDYLPVPFGIWNPGPGTLMTSNGSVLGGIMVPTPGSGSSAALAPDSSAGGFVCFDMTATRPLDAGRIYTTVISADTNSTTTPTVSLKATYRTLLEAPWLETVIGDGHDNNSQNTITTMWYWDSTSPVADATSFRIYRSLNYDGPYTRVGTVTNTGSTISALSSAMGLAFTLPANMDRGMTWANTGLSNDARYFYKIDAVLPGSPGLTAQSWDPASSCTCSKSLRDPFEPNDKWGMGVLQYATIGVGIANNANVYPRGDDDFYSFIPEDGHSYAISVANVSLTGTCWLSFDDSIGVFSQRSVQCDFNHSPATITWSCPSDYSSYNAHPDIDFWAQGNCSGSYTITVTDVTPTP